LKSIKQLRGLGTACCKRRDGHCTGVLGLYTDRTQNKRWGRVEADTGIPCLKRGRNEEGKESGHLSKLKRKKQKQKEKIRKLYRQINSGGRRSLCQLLRNRDPYGR
jgi:hypothetical protein